MPSAVAAAVLKPFQRCRAQRPARRIAPWLAPGGRVPAIGAARRPVDASDDERLRSAAGVRRGWIET